MTGASYDDQPEPVIRDKRRMDPDTYERRDPYAAEGVEAPDDIVDQWEVAVPAGGVEADQLRDFRHGRFAGCV